MTLYFHVFKLFFYLLPNEIYQSSHCTFLIFYYIIIVGHILFIFLHHPPCTLFITSYYYFINFIFYLISIHYNFILQFYLFIFIFIFILNGEQPNYVFNRYF